MAIGTHQEIILQDVLPLDIFNKLKEVAKEKNQAYNETLAGNILREENINHHIPLLEEFITKSIKLYSPFNEVTEEFLKILPGEENLVTLKLTKLWINHMKQHEFNPVHRHSGHYSFIIFVQVPFDGEDLRKNSPGVKGNYNLSGGLSFFYNGSNLPTTCLTEERILPDKTWEGRVLIFPAYLNHCVYPFYNTEESRITISGNVWIERMASQK
tara:strand:- start:25 stop:663 length:639 start_codon:yes stop_codon:yes gene_type:complete